MQVSVESTGELGRRLKVEVPADQIDGRVQQRIRELGKKVKLKGFRPGKVPMKVLEQRFGDQVREEVVNEVLRDTFQKAVSREKLRPAGTPEITAQGHRSGEKLEYTADFEVYPELDSLEVSGLEIRRPRAEVTEADVEGMIETLRRQRRSWEQVERGARQGDLVVIEYRAEAGASAHPAEGMERAGTVLGSGALFGDLEASLEGVSKGDEKTVEVTFPEDFRAEALAGAKGTVQLRVLSVSEEALPAVDADFAKSFGVASGDLEEFRAEVRRNLERELQQAVLERLRRQVVDGLVRSHPGLQVPESLVEEEAERISRQAAGAEGGEPPPASAFRDQARRRVTAGFLMTELASRNGIRPDNERVSGKIAEIAATYEQPEQVVEAYRSDPRLLESVRNLVLEEQVVEWVVENARVSDQAMSFDELMRPAEPSREA